MKYIILFLIVIPGLLSSLSFNLLEDHQIPGVSQPSMDWGDYDNDGYLDLFITGFTLTERIAHIYRNNGDGTFTLQEEIVLEGVSFSAGLWGDYNNDGFLDLVLSGYANDGDLVTKLYVNNGDGTFSENTAAELPGVRDGSLSWVDFDNNGWLDLFITGYTGTEEDRIARLYQNNGDGSFTWREDLEIPGYRYSDAIWGDINNNGFPDLIIAGNVSGTRTTGIYFNQNGEGLELQEETTIPGVDRCSLVLGDYNGDGHLDLLVTGQAATYRLSNVYQNDGSGGFELAAGFVGIAHGKGVFADLNNNGLLDVIICGAVTSTTAEITAKVFLNDGEGTFFELEEFEPTGLSYAALSAVDINNNGKTDIIMTGMISSSNKQFNIFLNQIESVNTPPLPPNLMTTMIDDDRVTFQWNEGSDAETLPSGLSYNIWLQQLNPPYLQLMAPMADMDTGFRKVNRNGNAGFNNSFTIAGLSEGQYQWSVQTIDSALTGSLFSDLQPFSFPDHYLTAPANLIITREDTQFYLNWDEVESADLYHIFGTEDPFGEDWELLDIISECEWVLPFNHSQYFFRVVAVTE